MYKQNHVHSLISMAADRGHTHRVSGNKLSCTWNDWAEIHSPSTHIQYIFAHICTISNMLPLLNCTHQSILLTHAHTHTQPKKISAVSKTSLLCSFVVYTCMQACVTAYEGTPTALTIQDGYHILNHHTKSKKKNLNFDDCWPFVFRLVSTPR